MGDFFQFGIPLLLLQCLLRRLLQTLKGMYLMSCQGPWSRQSTLRPLTGKAIVDCMCSCISKYIILSVFACTVR